MEKEENQNQENTQTETFDETVKAEQQSKDKQEDNKDMEEEKELTQMVNSIKNTFHALGTREKIISEEEIVQSKKMRRSLVAAKEMKIGDILTEDCLDAKRPGTGICVSEWDTYLKKKITKPIFKDSLLTKEHFE